MRVSIVIPNYNGLKLLEKNLDQIIKRSDSAEIIIVDDGSTDDSVKFIKNNYPQVKIIQKLFNDGFATSVNLGVKAVTNDIFLLLNTDTLPKMGFLPPLLRHFSQKNVFAVGCLDKSYEAGKFVLRGRGIGSFYQGFLRHQRGEVNQTDTLWVSGGSGAFRKSIWENLGGLDEIYDPFYWEDIDLSYRALKSGYKILFEPNSHVEHQHQEGAIITGFSETRIKQIAYRNQFIFVWKNITDTAYLFNHCLWLPYHLVKALMRRDWQFIIGFGLALEKLTKIIKSKSRQSRLFIKSDQLTLQPF